MKEHSTVVSFIFDTYLALNRLFPVGDRFLDSFGNILRAPAGV